MRLKLPLFEATVPAAMLFDKSRFHYAVFFIIYDQGKKKQFIYKRGINDLPVSKRQKQAQATAAILKEALQLGWDPRKDKYPRFDLLEKTEKPTPSFSEVLQMALAEKKKILSKYSMYDYEGTVRFFRTAADETGHTNVNADKITRKDIRVILETAVEQNQWSANARNKYLTILKALLTVMVRKDFLPTNPAHGIEDVPVLPTEGYKRLTDKERDEVAGFLFANHLSFYEYITFIYQVGIRRTELLQVTICDLNLEDKTIKIRPDVGKTNHFRYVPMTDELLEICMRRQIWTLPSDYFLFSEHFETGPKQIHPNTPSNWWRKIVIEGMGIDCKMYSLKHKGADDAILAGISLEALRTIYGHKSSQMTEIYAKAVKKQYAQEIINKRQALGKVIPMKKAN